MGFSRVAVQGVLRRVLLPLGELRTHKKRRPPLAQDSQGSPIAGVSMRLLFGLSEPAEGSRCPLAGVT